MPRRRRRPQPPRLDWRDPSMPVLRDYTMADGSHREIVDPDYERRYREHLLETTKYLTYDKDPTYNMRAKREKR